MAYEAKVEVYVIQPSSVPVDRRMRRAKSDGIDAELLLRTLLAWLRGEPRACSMVPVPDENQLAFNPASSQAFAVKRFDTAKTQKRHGSKSRGSSKGKRNSAMLRVDQA